MELITFTEQEAYDLALEEFIKMCGFKQDSVKHQKMLEHGMRLREEGVDNIEIKIVLNTYDGEVISDGVINIDDIQIRCDAMNIIDKSNIYKVYMYIVTAGECHTEREPILDRLYADMWGTAYVDAGIQLLRRNLIVRLQKEIQSLILSEAFGPGYYGMPTEEVKKFLQILDSDKINVSCRESGLMTPIKSVVGIFFATNKQMDFKVMCCKNCIGNHKGCDFCRINFKD